MEISCLYKGPMSKGVLPQEIRQISEGSPGIHTDQSHRNQLYKITNIHMSVMFNLHSNACSTRLDMPLRRRCASDSEVKSALQLERVYF